MVSKKIRESAGQGAWKRKRRAQGCEGAGVVEGGEDPELVECVVDVVLGGRVHEIEVEQVFHVQRL